MDKERISSYNSMIYLWEGKLKTAKNQSQKDWINLQIKSIRKEIDKLS